MNERIVEPTVIGLSSDRNYPPEQQFENEDGYESEIIKEEIGVNLGGIPLVEGRTDTIQQVLEDLILEGEFEDDPVEIEGYEEDHYDIQPEKTFCLAVVQFFIIDLEKLKEPSDKLHRPWIRNSDCTVKYDDMLEFDESDLCGSGWKNIF